MLRAYVNQYHTDWPRHIPSLVYAYNNNVHCSSTEFTPHRLLFGWCPRDIRAPLQSVHTIDCDVDTILSRCKTDFVKAKLSLEQARQRMIKAARGSPNEREYKMMVILSKYPHKPSLLKALALKWKNYSQNFLVPLKSLSWWGRRLELPDSFHSRSHDVVIVQDIVPRLSVDGFDVAVPSNPNSVVNPVQLLLDRTRAPGRVPKKSGSLLLIPAQYFVISKNGLFEWVHQRKLK
jgi:hypothetical protein